MIKVEINTDIEEFYSDIFNLLNSGVLDVPDDIEGKKYFGRDELTGLMADVVNINVHARGAADPVNVAICTDYIAPLLYGDFVIIE